jgi:GAF domain-containing protein
MKGMVLMEPQASTEVSPLPIPTLEEPHSILKISTDLQSDLIKQLNSQISLEDMLDKILLQVETHIRTDACSLYIVENNSMREVKERVARMRAARGYHQIGLKEGAFCRVVPPGEIVFKPTNPEEKLGSTGWVISTGRSFLAKSPDAVILHPHWRGEYDAIQLPYRDLKLSAFLGVPIRDLQGQIIGMLKAERLEEHGPFSTEDQITIEAMARCAGRCITYYRNAQQENDFPGGIDAAIVSWAMDVIHEADATEGELDAFLDITVRLAAAVALADSCSIFLVDEESKKALTQRAGYGNQVLKQGIRAYLLPDAERLANCRKQETCDPCMCANVQEMHDDERLGLTVWVAVTGKSFYARNYDELHKHCHHLGRFDRINYTLNEQCGAWLGMPLRVGGTVIGVLKVENVAGKDKQGSQIDREFSRSVRQRFDVLASEIALSIRRIQIQRRDRYKVIQKAMPTIFAILQGGFDLPELVRKVVQETARLFDARACALFLKEGNELVQPEWAAYGWAGLGRKLRRYQLVDVEDIKDNPKPSEKVGLTVWIAVKQQKFTARSNLELISHPHHIGVFDPVNFKSLEKCESFMGVPLLLNEGRELIGVLKVETKQRDVEGVKEFSYFNEQDELVFELIANIAAIAIQNARLLEARRLAEQLIALPSLDLVFAKLHHFIAGREDVLRTLGETAQILQQHSESRAKLVRSFMALLDPGYLEQNLVEIRDQVPDPLKEALSIFLRAMRVNSISNINELNLRINEQGIGHLLSSSFFLHESIGAIYNLLGRMSDDFNRYLKRQDRTSHLVNCQKLIRNEEENIKYEYIFERTIIRRILARWQLVLMDAIKEFKLIPNPYVAGRPLEPGSPVFFGREDIFKWLELVICESTVKTALVLHGGWHTGKTSILKQIAAGPAGQPLREHGKQPVYPVYVDLQYIPDRGTNRFLFNLASYIYQSITNQGVDCPKPDESLYSIECCYSSFSLFLEEVKDQIKEKGEGLLVLMLDEFELLDLRVQSQKIDQDIFPYLRSIIQHQTWIVLILAGRHRLEQMSDKFRASLRTVSQHMEVGFLSPKESRSLISEPVSFYAVTYMDEVIAEIIRLTGGQPYFIQQICWKCIDLLNESRSSRDVTLDVLNKAVNDVVRNNSILEMLWKDEINENSQAILRVLADWYGSNDSHPMPGEVLKEEAGLTKKAFHVALDELFVKQLIMKNKEGEFSFVSEMLPEWIRLND